MMKKVAIYARVSTDRNQTVENQLRELHEVAQRQGWVVVAVHTDEGISGAKGRDKRPGFDALLTGVTRKDFDMIAAWSVDRLGRSLLETRIAKLTAQIEDLEAYAASLQGDQTISVAEVKSWIAAGSAK